MGAGSHLKNVLPVCLSILCSVLLCCVLCVYLKSYIVALSHCRAELGHAATLGAFSLP
jgi:hypothetical protein